METRFSPDDIKRLRWRWFGVSFLTLFIGLAALSILWCLNDQKALLARIEEEQRHAVEIYLTDIVDSLDHVFADLRWLPKQNELIEFLDTGHPKVRGKIIHEYIDICASRPIYDQIRFIDEEGKELIRVDFNDGFPASPSPSRLQDKSDRYYFKETFHMPEGSSYISLFDLNLEQGKVEEPLKPVLRFATSIFDSKERWRGILVLNYLGKGLIDSLKSASDNFLGEMMLLNDDGYWLASPHAGDEWGFMFEEGKERTFNHSFPASWPSIAVRTAGQVKNEEGLFTFTTVDPNSLWMGMAPLDEAGKKPIRVLGPGGGWKIVSHIPPRVLANQQSSLQARKGWLLLISFLTASLLALFVSQGRVKLEIHKLELEQMAYFDNLTGLPNRALYMSRLEMSLKFAQRHEHLLALMVIDLDGFKEVNDTLGHDAGDLLLREVAGRFNKSVRQTDTVARTGGDEFTVILPKIETPEDASVVADKILNGLSPSFKLKHQECRVGASIGIGIFPLDGQSPDDLWQKADFAMYEAKQSGKNRYRYSAQCEGKSDTGDA